MRTVPCTPLPSLIKTTDLTGVNRAGLAFSASPEHEHLPAVLGQNSALAGWRPTRSVKVDRDSGRAPGSMSGRAALGGQEPRQCGGGHLPPGPEDLGVGEIRPADPYIHLHHNRCSATAWMPSAFPRPPTVTISLMR